MSVTAAVILPFRNEDDRGLVALQRKMAVDAVKRTRSASPPDNHSQNGGSLVSSVVCHILTPTQQVGILTKTFGKILFAKALHHFRVFQVGLFYELLQETVGKSSSSCQ